MSISADKTVKIACLAGLAFMLTGCPTCPGKKRVMTAPAPMPYKASLKGGNSCKSGGCGGKSRRSMKSASKSMGMGSGIQM